MVNNLELRNVPRNDKEAHFIIQGLIKIKKARKCGNAVLGLLTGGVHSTFPGLRLGNSSFAGIPKRVHNRLPIVIVATLSLPTLVAICDRTE